MRFLGAIGIYLLLVSLIQISFTKAQVCNITSITSPSASSLLVKWNTNVKATAYLLDLRIINSTDTAPVVITLSGTITERLVQGLRPGTTYSVTVKLFMYYYVIGDDTELGTTGPATSQITSLKALSSSSIQVEWARVTTAQRYYLLMQSETTKQSVNFTFTNTSTVVQNLQPSTAYDFYVYTANAVGFGDRSSVRTISTLVQPPKDVTAVQTGKRTAHVSWQPVEKVILYKVTVVYLDEPNRKPFMINASSTQMDIENILPCSSYQISVASYNAFLQAGEATEYMYTTNRLSAVTSISVTYNCGSSVATVTWTPVVGADSYRVVATSSDGTVRNCTSQTTQCQIMEDDCGKAYLVEVTSVSDSCETTSNITSNFVTAPCTPKDLQLYRECSSNVIIFSWAKTNNTNFYTAKAVDSEGLTMHCITEDNSCFFTETTCGRLYSFTVNSVYIDCNSQDSPAVTVRTAPCEPKNFMTSADCLSVILTNTWDPAEGALYYMVEAWGNNEVTSRYSCSSSNNSCDMTSVNCGESLAMHITAFDGNCHSSTALGQVAVTVPCVPQNVSADVACQDNSITLKWDITFGTLFYIGTVKDPAGVVHTCTSIDTQCQITGLDCSSTYTAFVTASNLMCNSSLSKNVTIESAPCPSNHIKAFLDCAANQALVVWQGHHSVISYTATMEDTEGGLLSCSTTGNNCTIPSLKCGQLYSVYVVQYNQMCPGLRSDTINMESVPCGPSTVNTLVDCGSGTLVVSWKASLHAVKYTTAISHSNGVQVFCNTTETSCNVTSLDCGQEYLVKVRSVNGSCLSLPSQAAIVKEVPCAPTNILAQPTCGESLVSVTWNASRGAKYYTTTAVSNRGQRTMCTSNNTACSLQDLLCGQIYSVSVIAVDDSCSSTTSTKVTLKTGPCPPTNVSGWVDCGTNTASLSWHASDNAISYVGTAVGTNGHSVTCNAATSACQLAGLVCGQKYNFTVSASDGRCDSPVSPQVTLETGPCVPQSVVNSLFCDNNTLSISWTPEAMGHNYSATAWAVGGTALSCTTRGSSCKVNGLHCGQQYSVTVTASSSNCTGPTSRPQIVYTVPCVPLNVRGVVDCASNTLQASWDNAKGAISYISMITSPDGHNTTQSTSSLTTSFTALECAKTYRLTVVAKDNQCSSSVSAQVSVTTAPCNAKNIAALLHCGSGVVTVSWQASSGANNYTALAQTDRATSSTSCRTTGTSCDLTQLECGRVYNVSVVAGDGICNSTLMATTTIKTAPCPPTIMNYSLDCTSNQATISWAKQPYAKSVFINGSTTLGHMSSCTSTNTSCLLDQLLCGQTYTVHAVAQGDTCDSMPSQSFEINTAPCTPTNAHAQEMCGTSIALLSWDESLGRVSFIASVLSTDHNDSCVTTDTFCSLTTLLCDHQYNMTVDALAATCNSSKSAATRLQTGPCAPQNISARLLCSNNSATVTWLGSPGAVSYNVVAQGNNGDTIQCTTNKTSCDLHNMQCAQTYEITVNPFSETCKGFDSVPYTFIAGPCPPTDVQTSLQCNGNIGSVSWAAAHIAQMYIATATDQKGHSHNCTTNKTTGCLFRDLQCGTTYAVSVVTIDRDCQSQPSTPVTLKAAICPPTNLAGLTNCKTNDLNITWNPSPETGVTYFLYSQKTGGANSSYSTAGTSHVISKLQCGEHFSFQITAQDSVCTSTLSSAMEIDTAPCQPTNLNMQANCGTNTGTITWNLSAGGVTYFAKVTGTTHSHTASCTSNSTSCSVQLDCGYPYLATMVAFSGACNSTMNTIQFDSAPCLPGNVTAVVNCSANTFAVNWKKSQGNPKSYLALAMGTDGSRFTCNTSSTACTINSLDCGVTYSIAVTTTNINCDSIQGSNYQVQSAPCLPQSPAVRLDCRTNIAVVTWAKTGPDQINMVSALDRWGGVTTCNSTSSNCTFRSLRCGQPYTLTVQGLSHTCRSQPSASLDMLTAPCTPTNVIAGVDCDSGITSVSWDLAGGANTYTVTAVGSGGHNATCTNSDTNCAFSDLMCGQEYTIVVLAIGDSCVSLASEPITTTTAPCPYTGLQASLDCSTNIALISWTPGKGILTYSVSAEGFDVTDYLNCSTSGSSCNISKTMCGARYQVSVRGEGRTCPSITNDWVTFNTAPCPPTALIVQSSCLSNNISLVWAASNGSDSYTAVAQSNRGHRLSCNTSITACDISGLLCGQVYKVFVAGVDQNCVGATSNIQVVKTAPCLPTNVQKHLDCPSGVLTVSWQGTGNAPNFYRTKLTSKNGVTSTCDTNRTTCVVPNIKCGQTYSVVVVAHDEVCTSLSSPPQQFTSAPCPPDEVVAFVDCATEVVTVTWDSSVDGVLYNLTAEGPSGQKYTCTTDGIGCSLNMLYCGMEYNLTVTPSQNGCVGVSSPSESLKTVPCIPHLTEVEMDCLSEFAWVWWNESAGAESYEVMAIDNQGNTFGCNTTDSNTCAVADLYCGENFTFTVTASDQKCSSAPSNALVAETAPCAPEAVWTDLGCDSHKVSVSWTPSLGALKYRAILERTDGEFTCCTSNGTGCDMTQLTCGQMYILTVTAEGRKCNSSQSLGEYFRTVPCIPQSLQASMSCSDNVATLTWAGSLGGQFYSVKAIGTDGHAAKCTSYENSCDLTSLHCGQLYNATVVAQDIDCSSPNSSPVEIKTVPCTPPMVSTVMDCAANSLSVLWSESLGADSYTATLQDSNRLNTTCQAMSGPASCNISGLSCGQIYHITVAASDGYCSSPSTNVTNTYTAPCAPHNINAAMDCEVNVGLVSWSMSPGALSYQVIATTLSGHAVTCQTENTFCELGGLACGEGYSVTVQALGQTCSSVATMNGQLVTGPCVPLQLNAEYSVTIGQVIWEASQGAIMYTTKAVTEEGQIISCTTSDTNCALYNMACSQMYNVTVTATNNICQDLATSQTINIETEPCPPNNVWTSLDCETGTGTVSWETSERAVGYVAFLNGRNGDSLSCITMAEDTSCSMVGLKCGTVYYASVRALGATMNSTDSNTVLLFSAPCLPASIEAEVDCENATALVTWDWSDGAQAYILSAIGSDGHQASCQTQGNFCNVTGLTCGQDYNLTLTTVDNSCQLDSPKVVSISTRPCVPLHVGVDLQCGTHTATLFWEQSDGVMFYTASATATTGRQRTHCNSTGSSCQFPSLDCGETYDFTVTAHSNLCQSPASSTVQIQTEPCQPQHVTATGSCHSDTVSVAWTKAQGAELYVVNAVGNLGYTTAFQTNESSLMADLPCGQMYNFSVTSQDELCSSASSNVAKFKTAPCVPPNVQTYTECEDSLGSVSWGQSDGAESYTAVAIDSLGNNHLCVSNSSTCSWVNLRCGELYTVHIISNDYQCSSSPSNSTTIHTAPCVPQNLVASMDCGMKVGSLTWNVSKAANFYIVTAESNTGHEVQLSTNDTRTYFSELQCGQEYYVSVQALDSVCRSVPSPPASIWTEPCASTSISSAMDCLSNIAVVTWLVPEGGAEYYTATALHTSGQSETCMSSTFSCGMPGLLCGQNYSITVTASNQQCQSDPSVGHILTTVPCVPANVVAVISCSDNTAVVSWNSSLGALSYKATAQGPHGLLSSCETFSLHCTLANLICGVSYNVQVVAIDNSCSSLPSQIAQFQTVPCSPNLAGFLLDCHTNSLLLQWASTAGAVSYTARAQSSDGQTLTCNTTQTNCTLMNLACGQTYAISMTSSNGQCNSFQGTSINVSSVPCPPQAVVSQLNCSDNSAQVHWKTSSGANLYTVQALSNKGNVSHCQSSTNTCILSALNCGSTYSISVTAVSNMCNTSMTAIVPMNTVPCVPEQLETQVLCNSGTTAVSWQPSQGAISYTAVAQSNSGYSSTCNSSKPSCHFPTLLCGLSYNITVQALDGVCTSAKSSAVQLNSVPCIPQNVSAQMECSTDTGLVSWIKGELVSSYLVRAVSPGGNQIECHSNSTRCILPSMHCGQLYNLTVTAQDGRCNNSKTHLTLQSVPCTPTNVQTSPQCFSSSVAMTWVSASGALSYQAAGTTDSGHPVTCNNSQTHCDLSGLQCGKKYNITVVSMDNACSSINSIPTHVRTAPCPPQNVAVDMQCANGSMTVTWSANPNADAFRVTAVTDGATKLSCNTTGTSCSIHNLVCGHTYNVAVSSVKGSCEGDVSNALMVSTVPCPPTNAQGSLDCVTNSAWVSWDASTDVTSYTVLAKGDSGINSTCSSSSNNCFVPGLACGTIYTLSVTALNTFCQSSPSNSFNIETGPCSLTNITVVTSCYNNIILVSWIKASTSSLYVATAQGQDQSLLICNSTSSSCQLKGARCGMQYTVIVSASSDKCSSLRSPPQTFNTAPCTPKDVTVVASCNAAGAIVSWDDSLIAQSYVLTAIGRDGDIRTCNSSVNNCTLVQLHCGQPYTVSVTARAKNCTSQGSTPVTFSTVPCDPSGLSVEGKCETGSAVLTWASSQGSVHYYGIAMSRNGDMLNCTSQGTSCTIGGLVCGTMYNFSVLASDGACNSSSSMKPLLMGAAPCAPAIVRNRMQLIGETLYARTFWTAVKCPDVQYLVEINGIILADPHALFQISSYWTERTFFELAMPCGSSYNLTVRTRNSGGTSQPSTPITGMTAPCAPLAVTYTVNNMSAVLSWTAAMFATKYTVYNMTGDIRTELCSTKELSCQLSHVQSGTIKVTASNAVGESVPTTYYGPSTRRRRDLRPATTAMFPDLTTGEELSKPEVLVTTVTGTSLNVEWAPVEGANRYTIIVTQEDTPSRRQALTVSDEKIMVKDLEPSTKYCIFIAAKNNKNQSIFTKQCVTTGVSM
ncbi:hypothetical protein UPYG_G00031900 [Umbra pygmaea]|uniref:Fibronectin type-III domain-containing protein n=1 Tax=Umbra pygmaea TaxID=75934 RepID=A0ABD0Y3M0_UMBPY